MRSQTIFFGFREDVPRRVVEEKDVLTRSKEKNLGQSLTFVNAADI